MRVWMYESFYGLRERPFDLTPNPKFLVLTESHREVLLNLEYGIASRKGITLLIGEAGSGKTTVIRAAMERQPVKVHCVHLHNPTLSRTEFNEMLATQFGLSAQASQSKAVMLIELERLLRERVARRRNDGPDRGRGPEPADGSARGDPAAGQYRDERARSCCRSSSPASRSWRIG